MQNSTFAHPLVNNFQIQIFRQNFFGGKHFEVEKIE